MTWYHLTHVDLQWFTKIFLLPKTYCTTTRLVDSVTKYLKMSSTPYKYQCYTMRHIKCHCRTMHIKKLVKSHLDRAIMDREIAELLHNMQEKLYIRKMLDLYCFYTEYWSHRSIFSNGISWKRSRYYIVVIGETNGCVFYRLTAGGANGVTGATATWRLTMSSAVTTLHCSTRTRREGREGGAVTTTENASAGKENATARHPQVNSPTLLPSL